MEAPPYLISNVDKVIGEVARAARKFEQVPQEIRASREAIDAFKDRMKHFNCQDKDVLKPLNLFKVPIIYQPGIGKFLFTVVWLDVTKMLRRRDHKF